MSTCSNRTPGDDARAEVFTDQQPPGSSRMPTLLYTSAMGFAVGALTS